HVERPAVGVPARVVERHDRRVLEARRDLDLALEPPLDVGPAARQDLLERDRATELHVERFDHAAHAAAPELGAELVAILARDEIWNRGAAVARWLVVIATRVATRARGHRIGDTRRRRRRIARGHGQSMSQSTSDMLRSLRMSTARVSSSRRFG